MEDEIEIARNLVNGLFKRMGIETVLEIFQKEGNLCLEVRGDREGILIGRHGRTLDSLQMLLTRMINKQAGKPVRVVLDIDDYRKRKADNLKRMAIRFGEKVKRTGRPLAVGPFNSHDRRIIHLALRDDPSIETESFGEGDFKKINIIPREKEG